MYKTHLAIAVFFILLFISHVDYKIAFVIVCLVATMLPDIDTAFSKFGRAKIARVAQLFSKHRGFFHSFTFCIVISIILALFSPTVVLALPFFLGYSVHLLADSFTNEGISPFWPYKRRISWKVSVGSVMEKSIFVSFLVVDLFMLVSLVLFR